MSDASRTPPAFRDRSKGLAVFGAVLVILGLAGLAAPMYMRFISGGGPSSDWMARVMDLGVAGTGMIWLGIGSIRARRWAAALLFSLGVIHFILGVLALPSVLILMFSGSGGSALVLGAAIRLVIPAALLGYYTHPDVRRTCEARDPTERWTDQCPLAVLGCCVLLAEVALHDLENCGLGQAMPFFGQLIVGPSGRGLWLAMALFTLYAVWGIYRFDRRDWTVFSAVYLLFGVSTLVTLVHFRPASDAPYSPDFGSRMWEETAALLTAFGYLICARIYFPGAPGLPAGSGGSMK
jgi:hypothetical protein